MADDGKSPLISIVLITYNHEKYIKQAVDSILNQQMNFKYELVIADDASTDSTQQILRKNYSMVGNVKLILREKNSEGKNTYLALQEVKGKYICICEGDDYWIGLDSIQTLKNWLEAHEEYVGVSGRRVTLSEKTGYMSINYALKTNNQAISLEDFLNQDKAFDLSVVLFKNFFGDGKYDYRSYMASLNVGDVTRALYILLHGKIFQLDKIMGVYRADRLKSSSSYNVTHTPKAIFEEHMELLLRLEQLLGIKLNLGGLRRCYVSWYVYSLPSMYELIRQMPYIYKWAGGRIAMEFLSERINHLKNEEK